MLKGKTKVELFDAETGKLVKSVEKHNEITSAYQKIINLLFMSGRIGDSNSINQYTLTKMFGGIIMFDSDVPDGAIVQDKANHCTGMAFYNNSESTLKKVGSCNINETSVDYDKKTATFVYDFATSQANGTVKSICLCNTGITLINGGNNGGEKDSKGTTSLYPKYLPQRYYDSNAGMLIGYGGSFFLDNGEKMIPLINFRGHYPNNHGKETYVVFFDFDGMARYGIRFEGNDKFYAVKQNLCQKKWSAFIDANNSLEKRNITSEEIVSVDLSSIYGGFDLYDNENMCQITGYNGIMYIMPTSSTPMAGGTNLSILKYNFNNFGIEGNEASFFNVLIPTGYDVMANYNAGFYVDSEYVYFVVTNGSKFYIAKASMTNNADSKILCQLELNTKYFPYANCGWMPGTFCYSKNDECLINVNLDDGSFSSFATSNYYYLYWFQFKHVNDFKTNYIYNFCLPSIENTYYLQFNYYDYTLKSINNLTDPIVKTNANTMKITYTLTETDS